jgi:Periplasmic binding protein-like domain
MNKRQFITLLGGAAAAWPLAASAQQPAMPVIGFLNSESPGPLAQLISAFHRGLNETGYADGKNVIIEYRWARGRYDRLREMATDLVRRRVAVIVTTGASPSLLAARGATREIPTVLISGEPTGRVIGIREALAARGVALPQERLIECPHKITEGQLALRALMQSSKRPTAVICGPDVLAFGALIEARQLGVAVPRDLSIAGINDAEFAAHLTPPLTTMRLPADEIGTRAAEYLLGSVNALPAASATQVQVSLIVRASTAPPSGRSRKPQISS